MSLLFLLSPAKSLDFESPLPVKQASVPQFIERSEELVGTASRMSPMQLQELMNISADLAKLNYARFQEWNIDHSLEQGARPALFSFNGDVYDGLQARQMGKREWTYLDKHLRILSGLYGVLRPLDAMRPYRLEMGCKLKHGKYKNLYDYWGLTITDAINEYMDAAKLKCVVNLASEEYFGVVHAKALQHKVITPIFEDFSSGKFKIVSFFAKKARGAMVRYCAENKIKKVSDLKEFDRDGYAFSVDASTETRWVFRRSN
ncbi:peroxide stress protein YaaA [Undibacterium cyanobacteriorum]|uniref:UPF0246 protein RF679_09870 n=1 Tax=Undibacterium cyanobacteriorum TaxID=3073561 RepID=A0ABY9RF79_9BURK|nr:peroxide stress protein YaaA [Undibacterium sp. 20NA77.5]WMW78970.1 peroxide stress protein YaaA [Undibacterium sp. 20NA77.5]